MTMPEGPEETGGASRRARILRRADLSNVPILTIVTTVLVVAVVYLGAMAFYRLRELIMLLVAGGFVALVLNPLVEMIERRHVRRGLAVAVVVFVSLLAFVGLAVAFGYPMVNSLTHLANSLPSYVDRAQQGKGWLGHLLRHYHVDTWIKHNSTKLISLARSLSKPALALGRGAVSVVLAMVVDYAFVILLLLEAPKIRRVILSLVSPEWGARLAQVNRQVSRAAAGYVLGNVITSVIAGLVVFVTLTLLGVPFAFLWGLWVAMVDLLPQIGGALAGIPTVLFAVGHSLEAGVVTLIVFLVYTQIENHVLNPIVMSRAVKLNPLTVFIAVLVGAEVGAWIGGIFGGLIGVLLAVPGAATIQVVVVDAWSATTPTSSSDEPTAQG